MPWEHARLRLDLGGEALVTLAYADGDRDGVRVRSRASRAPAPPGSVRGARRGGCPAAVRHAQPRRAARRRARRARRRRARGTRPPARARARGRPRARARPRRGRTAHRRRRARPARARLAERDAAVRRARRRHRGPAERLGAAGRARPTPAGARRRRARLGRRRRRPPRPRARTRRRRSTRRPAPSRSPRTPTSTSPGAGRSPRPAARRAARCGPRSACSSATATCTSTSRRAQVYAWLEEDDPALLARIEALAGEGRFEPIGGMWVEPDCVMPAGESLVRQLLYGQRYFARRFGAPHTVCWLPDCFGFSPALPQLLRGAGIERFFTIKLSWSETNRFPHDLFWWEGLDGSRVLAHMFDNPEGGYNGDAGPRAAYETWRRFRRRAPGEPADRRLRRRWGRHHRGDGRARRGAGRLPGAPGAALRARRRLLRSRRGRAGAADVGGRALPRAPSRHADHPGPHQARPPPRGARARGRRGDRGARRAGRRAARRSRSSPHGACCCATSSTTSCPAAASARSTRTPRPSWPPCRRRRSGRSAPRWTGSPPASTATARASSS